MNKGIFCISIDLELLWGRRAGNYKSYQPLVAREREIIKKILHLFKKYKIHATWATVGHLFLEGCSSNDGKTHSEIVRSQILPNNEDWFAIDPASSQKEDPDWYGKDILATIQQAPFQEIGSHSFSHIRFGDSGCSRATAESEIAMCVNLAKKERIVLASFVYPYNSIKYLSLLKKYKFLSFRGKEKHWYSVFPSSIEKICMLVDFFLPTPPFVSRPELRSGVLNIPGSFYFLSGRGLRRKIPKGFRFRKAKRGIDKAIAKNEVFHLWFHPIDIISENDVLVDELEKILEYAATRARRGELATLTMKETALFYI